MTKFRYTKARLRSNLRLGLFFVMVGVGLILLSFITGGWEVLTIRSVGFGQIASGGFMIAFYSYENKKQYLTLKNGELIKNTLFPKKIKLNQIKGITEFASDLKLKTDKSEFIIDTLIIDPDSLIDLKSELKKYSFG